MQRLQQYDMMDVFTILRFLDSSLKTPLLTTLNLLEQWNMIDMGILTHHIHFMLPFGQEYDLQNLTWTLELLENSCDQSLTDSVQENLLGLDSHLECGMMYFYLMMRQIISSTEDAVGATTTKTKNINIADFEAKDIAKVTGQLKMAIKRLEVLNKVPEDLKKNILSILQTTSVSDFNLY